MATIQRITAREIIDSRGNPTTECTVVLTDTTTATASCPSGASTGTHEAVELRDNDLSRYNGKGVQQAVKNINDTISRALVGRDAASQKEIDDLIITLDGTPNKSKLGANATLPVSMAVARAQSESEKIPLFRYIQKIAKTEKLEKIPTPLFNILNGGKHAGGNIDFQEFMVIPGQQNTFENGLHNGVLVYTALKKILAQKNLSTLVGDEGGFGPTLANNEDALLLIKQAIEAAGFTNAESIFIGLDVASDSFYKDGVYFLKEKPQGISATELIDLYSNLANKYQLLYLEDGLFEDDFDNWTLLTAKLAGTQTIVTGDDLLVTNPQRLTTAIQKRAATGIIIKLNQIGTVSEGLNVVELAKQSNIKTIVSHRSGETNDDFIADFAIGVQSDFVKFGAPARGERIAKYNRLLEIESMIHNS